MLDLKLLDNVRRNGNRLIAACPACRAGGHDKQGEHFYVYPGDDGSHESGAFGCYANDDSAHRSEIFSHIGIKTKVSDINDYDAAIRRREYARRKEEHKAKQDYEYRITQVLEKTLYRRLAPYISDSWKIDLLDDSPMNFDCPEAIPHDFILNLFQPEDTIWMGNTTDTGRERHRSNFKTCRQWLEEELLPPRIAPCTFHDGVYSRSASNLKTSPYIIIESDDLIGYKPVTSDDKELNKALSYALIGFSQEQLNLKLRAVVESGNKSLHCWYDYPPGDELAHIKTMARGLRIDLNVLNQSHAPLRMPGCIHGITNQAARILYLNPTSLS